MGVLLVMLGCVLLYLSSKHAPKNLAKLKEKTASSPRITRSLLLSSFLISIVIFCSQSGLITGLLVFLLTGILGLCLTVILFPLKNNYAYLLAGFSLLVIVIENIV